ncbi:MAG: ATP-binding protein [Actinobacteria bacterium]|nr:ATP-binding protein [Actinomycetota bacterium]
MLGRLPWLALLRRIFALRFLVFFDMGRNANRPVSWFLGDDTADDAALAAVSAPSAVGYTRAMTGLLELSLPCESTAPGDARREVRAQLAHRCPPEVVVDVLLVVSELVTNAVRHARSGCTLVVDIVDGGLVIEVHDSGGWPRRATLADPDPPRGLGLVQSISTRWGVERTGAGKCVWVELDTSAGSFEPTPRRRSRC